MDRFRTRDLLGKRVLTRDGIELGEILDVELEPAGWRVTWIFTRLHRDVTDRFHISAPFVMGTKAIALQPQHARSVSPDAVRLSLTLAEVVAEAVVSFDTDATLHLGAPAG